MARRKDTVNVVVACIAVLTMLIASLSPAIAAEKSSCRGCRYSCIVVPVYGALPELFIIDNAEGVLRYQAVNQVIPGEPINRIKHWCMCMDADNETGPNYPPEHRRCGYFVTEGGIGADSGFAEAPYCEWTGFPSSATCGGNVTPCPDL